MMTPSGTDQGLRGFEEGHYVGRVLDDVAGDEGIERAVLICGHGICQGAAVPDKIHLLDPARVDASVDAVLRHEVAASGVIDDEGVPAISLRGKRVETGSDLDEAGILCQRPQKALSSVHGIHFWLKADVHQTRALVTKALSALPHVGWVRAKLQSRNRLVGLPWRQCTPAQLDRPAAVRRPPAARLPAR